MYKVTLTTDYSYSNIKSVEVWDLDDNYFIFDWGDGSNIIIKKEYIISIHKTKY